MGINFQVQVGVEPLERLPSPTPPDRGHHAKVRDNGKFQTWPRPAGEAATHLRTPAVALDSCLASPGLGFLI